MFFNSALCYYVILCFLFIDFLFFLFNRVLEVLMMMVITDGHHGWNLCWKRISLFNANYMLILTRVNVICIVWIVWMVLFVLFVLLITKITVLFRFDSYSFLLFLHFLNLFKNFYKLRIWHILVLGLDLFLF
jgi:hypothetical protein